MTIFEFVIGVIVAFLLGKFFVENNQKPNNNQTSQDTTPKPDKTYRAEYWTTDLYVEYGDEDDDDSGSCYTEEELYVPDSDTTVDMDELNNSLSIWEKQAKPKRFKI